MADRYRAQLEHARGAVATVIVVEAFYTGLFVALWIPWTYIVWAFVKWGAGHGFGVSDTGPTAASIVATIFWGTLLWADTVIMVPIWIGTYRYLRHRQPLPPPPFAIDPPTAESSPESPPRPPPPATRWDRSATLLLAGFWVWSPVLLISIMVPTLGLLNGPLPYIALAWTAAGVWAAHARRKERARILAARVTATEKKAEPPPPPVQNSYLCPTCQWPLSWVPAAGRWFCAREQRYT